MVFKVILFVIVALISQKSAYGQQDSLNCTYINYNAYKCSFRIYNPAGRNNFTDILGIHIDNKNDLDVTQIESTQSNSLNVPSIICKKFPNLQEIGLTTTGLQRIDSYSFKDCKKLQALVLYNNRITEIAEDAFAENVELVNLYFHYNQLVTLPESIFNNLYKLSLLQLDSNQFREFPKKIFSSLYSLTYLGLSSNQLSNLKLEWFDDLTSLISIALSNNQIEELPVNIFSSLRNCTNIFLQNNKIKIIHSESFPNPTKLREIHLNQNQIFAIDEKLIDNSSINYFNGQNNVCVNSTISDSSTSKEIIKAGLSQCFENYRELIRETTTDTSVRTTTISPSRCFDGNLDDILCTIGTELENYQKNHQELKDENQRLKQTTEELYSQLEQQRYDLINLWNEKQNFQLYLNSTIKYFSESITELQNQIKQNNGNCTRAFRSIGPFNFY